MTNFKHICLAIFVLILCKANLAFALQDFFAEAEERIEQHRKTGISVVVKDSDGKPVPDAQVHVSMKRHAFRWGSAIVAHRVNDNSSSDNETYRQRLLQNFNSAAIENAVKWPAWEGLWGPDFGWGPAEQAITWCDANELPVRGHYLSWATLSGPDGWGPNNLDVDPDLIEGELFAHMADKLATVGTRIKEWDVINHPVGWGPVTYQDLFGPDFYSTIFGMARDMAPSGAELWMNEDDILNGGPVADQYEQVLNNLIAAGHTPDGIGIQGHFKSSWNRNRPDTAEKIYDQLQRLSEIVPRIQLTEFDIDVGVYDSDNNLIGYDEQEHARLMNDYLISMFSHPNLEGITMWGFWEGAHWLPEAALYNQDWTERPALAAYRDLVFGKWWTEETGQTDVAGEYLTRGFKGEYQITVTHDGAEFLVTSKFDGSEGPTVVTVPAPETVLGDFTGDGIVSWKDVRPFVKLYRSLRRERRFSGEVDINQDGVLNHRDILSFRALLPKKIIGDFNFDGVVNEKDTRTFTRRFGWLVRRGRYGRWLDINQDGVLNDLDISSFFAIFRTQK